MQARILGEHVGGTCSPGVTKGAPRGGKERKERKEKKERKKKKERGGEETGGNGENRDKLRPLPGYGRNDKARGCRGAHGTKTKDGAPTPWVVKNTCDKIYCFELIRIIIKNMKFLFLK